uniref:Putative ovule protein n=1 Tax=Solanum chacoense TaxID=4108 RepID=A0A0V0GW05_SOLCH
MDLHRSRFFMDLEVLFQNPGKKFLSSLWIHRSKISPSSWIHRSRKEKKPILNHWLCCCNFNL